MRLDSADRRSGDTDPRGDSALRAGDSAAFPVASTPRSRPNRCAPKGENLQSNPTVIIRAAAIADAPALVALIHEFAAFDARLDRCTVDIDKVKQLLVQTSPPVQFVLAETGGNPAGFASYYFTWSTATARAGLWLEDLYVCECWRRAGIGASLVRHVARLAAQTGCTKMEWTVGSDNQPAIDFYRSLGAVVRSSSRICRLPIATRSAPADEK